jgi:type I restriction-modification system DNA methylase subunit
MNKIKKNKIGISSPMDMTIHKSERTAVAILTHWMRDIIEKKNLDLGFPDVETLADDRLMPDAVIYESPRSQKVLCVLEAKPPDFDIFNERELKRPAREKAIYRKAKYFAITNFNYLIWFNTAKMLEPEENQIVEKYVLSDIENLDEIEQTRHSNSIKKGLQAFLTKLHAVHYGKEPEPKLAIDEFLVFRLHQKINVLANYYRRTIEDQCHRDAAFARQLISWFLDQGWSFAWQPDDFMKAARQSAYLLVNKILFYDLVQAKRPKDLDPLEIPESRTKISFIQSDLESYFREILKIDYESIFVSDFIDRVAFPKSDAVVEEIKGLANILRRYDFSKLGFDIIGRIFERLIPPGERHNFGQYFTNPDIVDLILKFCMHHEEDTIVDPSCGAGTFLVRAYQHKKMMNERLSHEQILETLWGNDIAKFPAHLAAINLAINDLGVDKNYPNILKSDFFELQVGDQGFDLSEWRKKRAATLGLTEREITYPRWFNAVVGNPPYTRQEEISEIAPDVAAYKEGLIENSLYFHDKKIANIGKRAGIHAYFFVHGTKFLVEGGYFGFIVSNSWLDVDYGKGLQEFFLKNYKIIAIIESKMERWFEEADINTCIVILQKCSNEQERNDNLTRFVYLKRPLREFIPPAQDLWEKQLERLNQIDKLKRTILAHNDVYENKELRIFPKRQRDLWDEGYELESEEFVGAKWGKYLRAPEIFFKLMEKAKDKLVPLKEVADVRFGIKTGANEFFYLTEEEIKQRKIEEEFWQHQDKTGNSVANKVIVSPRECKRVVSDAEEFNRIVLFINSEKDEIEGKRVLSYIKQGEHKGFHQRPTCASRKIWYNLERRDPWPILFPMIHHDRQTVVSNKNELQVDHNLFEIKPKKKRDTLPLLCFLLSTVSMMFKEFGGRVNLGEGALKTEGIDVEKLLVIKYVPNEIRLRLKKLAKKYPNPEIDSIFQDLNAENASEICLENIRPARRELDKIILSDLLGLTETEQLDVYRAVIDLVRSRITKSQTFGNNKKSKISYQFDEVKDKIVNIIRDGI